MDLKAKDRQQIRKKSTDINNDKEPGTWRDSIRSEEEEKRKNKVYMPHIYAALGMGEETNISRQQKKST
ncbi:uncharacterized protein BO95DRAFT_443024 [Aspergillus brunneoviolaceus CBS 621.78]|uniref:Uncharacterized protein n=1 Tax=Aspergillus brunneoviolaceus CBS 621.78 TaxID=1450534 RepID=A0ACD1G8Q5_9EURO|nr:hypothetical protein BO95DRAFT_443024 [Aspergillus brunneoviolaceus CBS 621.78]RAH45620.1 hypothetical protein BO95DRAFT_443024 [Aspergillus brunneoviolaceus CBS 621.78]